MSLIGKYPVDKPCEAESFEEAHRKNKARLDFERRDCKDLYEQMKKDGEKGIEAVDPAFWTGAIAANEGAYEIYREELEAMNARVAMRLAAVDKSSPAGKAYESGWSSIRDSWVKALEKNDPSIIVYW